jgi:hypothetical protein
MHGHVDGGKKKKKKRVSAVRRKRINCRIALLLAVVYLRGKESRIKMGGRLIFLLDKNLIFAPTDFKLVSQIAEDLINIVYFKFFRLLDCYAA